MTKRKLLPIIAVAAPVVILAVMLLTRPGHEAQAKALFERIADTLEHGPTGDLVEEVEPGYDFVAHFPILDSVHEQALAQLAGEGDPDAVMRESLRRYANQWYGPQQLRTDQVVTWRLHEVGERAADGSFTAHVSLSVEGLRPMPTLTNHRFVLATHGWLRPVARIRDHDPISL